jgi:hypothetical protein
MAIIKGNLKIYGIVEVYLHVLFTFVLEGDKW